MKAIIIAFSLSLFLGFEIEAQKIVCGTKVKGPPILITQKTKDSLRTAQLIYPEAINTPYCVKVYITVFANDNGTLRGDDDANILINFQYMVSSFQAHNVCFMLAGIRQVNNTDLNTHNIDSEPNSELTPYLVSGFLNILIHNQMADDNPDTTPNGMSYGIPNTYLSLNGTNYNIATMGHEMGHCLGLYHTFHGSNENVDRSGACKNCETAGDVLCDTPADDNGSVNETCVYTGAGQDTCTPKGNYNPLTNNMMTYGNFICRNSFTLGQGDRVRTFLLTNTSLNNLILQDNLYNPVFFSTTYNSGTQFSLARDNLYLSNGAADLTVSANAIYYFQAKKVTISSGTKFLPTVGGKISVKSNPFCN